jgi:hypothetical protein
MYREVMLRNKSYFSNQYSYFLSLYPYVTYLLTYLRIIRMIKSRRMRWAGYVARMREKRNGYRIVVGKPEENRPLGRQDVGGCTILNWIFER